jgi:outer membrane protein assembly factor BamE
MSENNVNSHFFITLFLSIILMLPGCAVYKIDIQQGNLVTQEMLDQLELQMPAQKVRFIMGTPLLVDVFHQNRWDYLYNFQPGGKERQQRRISLFFEDERLVRVEGDVTLGTEKKAKPETIPETSDQPPIL